MGKRQSGKDALSWFKAAQLPGDRALLETARALASELVADYTVQTLAKQPRLKIIPAQI